jgi:lysozyme
VRDTEAGRKAIMPNLKEQLKRHEGLRLKPYRCPAGKLTIGYGRNIDDCGIAELNYSGDIKDLVITEEQASLMLDNDILKFTREVAEAFPWAAALDKARQNVLINMAFNMGTGTDKPPKPKGLKSFKRTLAAIKAGEYAKAADMMLQSKWAKQVGDRAVELSGQMRNGGNDV